MLKGYKANRLRKYKNLGLILWESKKNNNQTKASSTQFLPKPKKNLS